MKVGEILGRFDYALISQLIPEGAKVLDLGCGDGALLAWLKENKNVQARGVEIRGDLVQRAIGRGVTVWQGDIEQGLADYPEQAFDYVVLSQTLQEAAKPLQVLNEMLRVGRHAIVAFPNFGHWRVRLAHLFSGRAPQTELFPYDWYDSPNIHFLTVEDFEEFCRRQQLAVLRRSFLAGQREVSSLPNLLSEVAIYLIRRNE
jgi:methionine biosynthesis protein MetW